MLTLHHVFRCRQLLAMLACAVVTACTYPQSDVDMSDSDYRARYPIRVESDLVQANFIGSDAGKLTLSELVQLDQIVGDYIAHGQKPLVIVMPRNAAHYRSLANEIEQRVRLHDLARSEVLVGVDPEAAMNNEVTVSFLMYTAVAPECGYWQEDIAHNVDNANSENFGCATQHNLALMVANPGDLVVPQSFSTRDAQRTAAIIMAYQEGNNPQVTWPGTGGGTQLDFGSD